MWVTLSTKENAFFVEIVRKIFVKIMEILFHHCTEFFCQIDEN